MTKNQIKREFLKALHTGTLINLKQKDQIDVFNVSMDKYSDIIYAIQGKTRVLDVGCAGGVMLSMLHALGHECHGIDILDRSENFPNIFKDKGIQFHTANAEIDPLPYPDNYFDAVTCGQCLEHFTHSPRHAMEEFYRVLKPGGIVEIDVPNVACFRNRSRLLRGKNITWDFESAYYDAVAIQYNNMSFFPMRHNREYTKAELHLLLRKSGFKNPKVNFIESRHHYDWPEKLRLAGSRIRDLIPSFRKTLIGFGTK